MNLPATITLSFSMSGPPDGNAGSPCAPAPGRRRAGSGSAVSSPTCAAHKAEALDAFAAEKGRACVRFDYSGHGESGGDFADGTIGQWHEESLAVFDAFCEGPQIAIGSSMGGWDGAAARGAP